ncbi:hypothetical protein HK405_005200 [Cladochytrium tenue]|nr:hypothetical protein HK405_005200 [Cladochytrium tenue]
MNADQAQNAAMLPLVAGLLAYVTRKCIASRSAFNLTCLASCVFLAVKVAVIVTYNWVLWLPAWTLFTAIFIPRGVSLILTYYLYELRLSVFFLTGVAAFRAVMRSLLAAYVAATVALVVAHGLTAFNTPQGRYTVAGTPAFATKVLVYLLDSVIGFVVFCGTVVSLGRLLAHARVVSAGTGKAGRSSDHGSPLAQRATLYRVLLFSDAARFLFIQGIDIYLMVTSTDPSGRSGALPDGNVGFINVVDTARAAVLVLNLYLPSGIAALMDTEEVGGTGSAGGVDGGGATSSAVIGRGGIWSGTAFLPAGRGGSGQV